MVPPYGDSSLHGDGKWLPAFDIRGYGIGSKMQDKRLFLELRKAASELRHNQKVDPLVFEIVELLEKRV
jgi:hypothetical protein